MSALRDHRGVRDIDMGAIWVCVCCTLEYANGECCADHDDIAPWSDLSDKYTVTMGLLTSEHDEECEVYVTGEHSHECDCERREFTWSSCDGCGSSGGERHAFTLWRTRRRYFRMPLPA